MSVVIVATPGASNANSYATEAEVDAYFAARLPLNPPWLSAADPTAAMAMATRTLDAYLQPYKELIPAQGGNYAYYRVRAQWTGAPATTTQRLAWPRTGMFDANGNAIPSNVIPDDLKDTVAELAGQLVVADTTLDNAVIVQGLQSVRAGSVALTFKDTIERHVLPDIIFTMMPQSWFTDELIIPAWPAQFDVVSDV